MSRDIYFFKRSKADKTFNSSGGDQSNVFNENIDAIQKQIMALKILADGDGSDLNIDIPTWNEERKIKNFGDLVRQYYFIRPKGDARWMNTDYSRAGVVKMIAASVKARDRAVNLRDAYAAGRQKPREYYNGIIGALENDFNYTLPTLLNKYRAEISKLQNVDLPQAIELKNQHERNLYDQTFAEQGKDVKLAAEALRLENEAKKKLAETEATLKRMKTDSTIKIAEATSKNTRNIIIVIVAVAVVVTSILVFKRLKNK